MSIDILTNWDAVQAQFQEHWGKSDWAGALALLESARDHFPKNLDEIDYLRLCAVARLGDTPRLLTMLEDKLKAGFWYGEDLFRQTPSFASLQGQPAFEQIVARSVEIMNSQFQTANGRLRIAAPEKTCTRENPCPAILALHGGGQGNEETFAAWRPAALKGWLVAAPLSSQLLWRGAAMWADYETAQRDVLLGYEKLKAVYAVDETRLVLGGFSAGGETVIRAALDGTLPARGFIVLGPGGDLVDHPAERFAPIIEAARGRSTRGYFLVGPDDPAINPSAIRQLYEMLKAAGFPCGWEDAPGIGHDYPADFSERVERALAFILGGD